jgi:hypothetical protein
LGARGIRVNIRQVEMGTFLTQARAPKKSFDMLVAGVPGDVGLAFVGAMFESRQAGGALDYTGFHTTRLDSAFAAARAARTDADRVVAWQTVQRMLAEDMPVAWIYHSRGLQGISARLKNVVMDLRGEMPTLADLEHRAAGTHPLASMSLLIQGTELPERRRVAAGALLPLARSLADELRPLLSRDLYFPTQKALLSREGGRCANDGTLLAFDPFQPHEHRCPRCGEVYRGELHDRFWIYWYQLWLAERSVHAAVLAALDVDRGFATLAESILDGYVDRYSTYPNADNVLGPTRLFFSTYLESIWLLQICCAADLVDGSNHALADRVRDSIIEPARAIISEFDEGASNRQVWNAAAILAASRSLGDDRAAHHAVFGPSGVTSHIANGLLRDGTWYEGENYHMFAHRGLWYGVTLAERAGMELPKELTDRFQLGFATPFLTALPDFTLPSRRDSQYAISLRQWRIAEHCELGLAREADPALIGALERMYRDDVPRRDTGRRASSADVERNAPASSLTRADLSWRALLCARETLPPLEPLAPRSALLDAQGIAVFRRNQGRSYVALDYGHSGGGHGHPDRLNLLISDGSTRWLDDFGTGSYVDPSLHWYRSTLAHNAPLADGTSQQRTDGVLLAYDERGAPVGSWRPRTCRPACGSSARSS